MFKPRNAHKSVTIRRHGAAVVGVDHMPRKWQLTAARGTRRIDHQRAFHSHSIVPGGLDVISYVTRLIPRTSLTIRFETRLKNSMSNG